MADTIKIRVTPIVNKINVRVKEGGIKGDDGYTPIKGTDYVDGTNGVDGIDGTNGINGYTPIKGTDYFDGVDGIDGVTPVKGVDYFDGVTQDISGKVDKVLNKSLILDTEIIRLASVSNVDISGKEDLSNKKIDVETNKTSDAFYPSIKSIVDWVTNLFVKGSGTENYLPKFGVGGKVLGNSNVYESSTSKVGLGTLSPTELLELYATHVALAFTRASTSGSSRFHFKTAASYIYSIGLRTNRSDFTIYDEQLALERFTILKTNGNILIGTLTDSSSKLNVAGSIKVADDTAVASATNVGATRYRATADNSYLETCMQTSLSGYAWIVIKQNTW